MVKIHGKDFTTDEIERWADILPEIYNDCCASTVTMDQVLWDLLMQILCDIDRKEREGGKG